MVNKKPPIKNQILEDYLISSSHDVKSIGGLIVSGIISTFGVYSIIKPFFEEGSNSLNIALFSFIIVLIIFDTVKRGALTKFFNSLLKKKIINSKAKKGYLIIAVFATIFMVLLDGLGSWSTAEKGANLYTQFKTNSSTEYQILQQNAESGKATAQNYKIELEAWQQSKTDAQTTCNEKWNGWKAKYKAKCKEEWNTAHPMPKQTTTGQIKIDDYKNIKNDQQSFLDEYLFIILFVLLSLMTLLMQYLTIAKIYDDYNEIEEGLTYERIQFINDTIQEHETIVAEHEQKTAEMMANSTREKKGQDRKFQEVGEAIAITHKKKMVDTRAETVKRIANNTYVPREESKAGHVINPFFKEEKNQAEKNKINYFNFDGKNYEELRSFLIFLHNKYTSHGFSVSGDSVPSSNKTVMGWEEVLLNYKNGVFGHASLYVFDSFENIAIIQPLNESVKRSNHKAMWREITEGDYPRPKDILDDAREQVKHGEPLKLSNEFIDNQTRLISFYIHENLLRDKGGKIIRYDNQSHNEPLNGEHQNKPQNNKPLNESVKRSDHKEPLNEEQGKSPQNTQPLNESVITDRKENEPLNGVVKRMDLKNYSHGDLELINLLWKQSTVKRNDQLETRDNVLKIIGDNKNNTLRLRNLYKKLLADGYIYKRVGYFANVEV